MERLAGLQHDVVGDVDDVINRPHPRGGQALLHPARRGAELHALDHRCDIPKAEVRVGDLHGHSRGRRIVQLFVRVLRFTNGRACQRRDFSRNTDHREPVRTVRRDVEIEDGVSKVLCERRADRRVGGEDEYALVFAGEAQLLLRADHARRLDAPDLRRLEDGGLPAPAIDQASAGPGERDLLARSHVGRAADHRQRLFTTVVDRREPQTVRVRVRIDGQHAANGDQLFVPITTDTINTLRFEAGHGQAVANLLWAEVDVHVFGEPFE